MNAIDAVLLFVVVVYRRVYIQMDVESGINYKREI